MEKSKIVTLLTSIMEEDYILRDEPMSAHTTFKIGGPADFYVIPQSMHQLKRLISMCQHNDIPYFVIGNGSNLLVRDEGIRGIVIQVYKNFSEIEIEGTRVTAQAGVSLAKLAKEILSHALTGFEFASGIPGTLGGAVYMNAGAYGGEMKDVLLEVTVLNEEGVLETLSADELELGYRHSILHELPYTLISATLQLENGKSEDIMAQMLDLNGRRKEKQPLEMPSAGSTFKRPEGYFAGKLIMDAGLKGFAVGGAQVSEKHCGFVVNTGNATCQDVELLIQLVQQKVFEQFGVQLETEVKVIGGD